jgi:peroxiredoxin
VKHSLHWLRLSLPLALLVLPGAPRTLGQQIGLGSPISGFELQDMHGRSKRFRAGEGRVTVLLFFSTRCPLSNAFNYRRNMLYNDFHREVRVLLVDPNANESLAEVSQYAKQTGFEMPVYRDVDGKLAERLGVRVTTDTFVLDRSAVMRYRGNIENSPHPDRATQRGLRTALLSVLSGQPVTTAETRSIGCAVRRSHAAAD